VVMLVNCVPTEWIESERGHEGVNGQSLFWSNVMSGASR